MTSFTRSAAAIWKNIDIITDTLSIECCNRSPNWFFFFFSIFLIVVLKLNFLTFHQLYTNHHNPFRKHRDMNAVLLHSTVIQFSFRVFHFFPLIFPLCSRHIFLQTVYLPSRTTHLVSACAAATQLNASEISFSTRERSNGLR